MAYMSQEHKKEINDLLKEVMPENWKYSLSVKKRELICLTIRSADVDLISLHKGLKDQDLSEITSIPLNRYFLDRAYEGEILENFKKISKALDYKNYDNSNAQADHFDRGHYVKIQIGQWDKPFKVIEPKVKNPAKKKLGM